MAQKGQNLLKNTIWEKYCRGSNWCGTVISYRFWWCKLMWKSRIRRHLAALKRSAAFLDHIWQSPRIVVVFVKERGGAFLTNRSSGKGGRADYSLSLDDDDDASRPPHFGSFSALSTRFNAKIGRIHSHLVHIESTKFHVRPS